MTCALAGVLVWPLSPGGGFALPPEVGSVSYEDNTSLISNHNVKCRHFSVSTLEEEYPINDRRNKFEEI